MNTLEYFLSALRPAPPPSPRASTSHLPISAALSSSAAEADDDEETGSSTSSEPARRPDDGTVEADEQEQPVLTAVVAPPSRRSSRKGKARAVAPVPLEADAEPLAREDPVRDGETVKTELERGEGVESAFVEDSGSAVPSSPPPSYDDTMATADPEKGVVAEAAPGTSASSTGLVAVNSPSTWPWMTRLARWWPFRLSVSVYVLVRRFLSLFGLPYSPRPSYNALLAPALSTESSDPAQLDEKGTSAKRHARIASLALTLSQRSLPPSATSSSSPTPSPSPSAIPRAHLPPPKLTPKTLVLDLDETLIHSIRSGGSFGKRGAPKGLKTRVVEVMLDGRSTVYTVYKRPWVDFFLRKVSSWYTVVIFTASVPEYADPVIDWLDGGDGRGGMVGARLFRSDCMARNGSYVKDLSVVDADLSRVCLVDNSPASYAINQANGIPIEGWINDPHDECLLDLLPMLDSLRFTNDVRRVLGLRGFGRREGVSLRPARVRMSGWHGAPERSPSPYDSSRARPRRRRSPSASSSVLAPLHWPRDASPALQPHKHQSTVDSAPDQHSSHPSQRERRRRRSPSPSSRTRLDSPRTAAHTYNRSRDLPNIDEYDPPMRRRRSRSPRPPTHSRRRSSRSRSPRRSGPRDGRALDERRYRDEDDERSAPPAATSGWDGEHRPAQGRAACARGRLEGEMGRAGGSEWELLATSYQQSYHSGLVGPSYIEFSPSPAPSLGRSPSRSPSRPSRSPRSALDEPRLATPSPSSSLRLAPATSTAHPVWLGPLPADLHPDEVVALLASYGHAAFRLHLAETGDGDEAYALEYRIHPTRLVSPYPRSPSPGEAAWLAVREAEIEKEMDDEVREALRDRWEREGWEKWIERWEKAEVVDLTQDDDEEEGPAQEAEGSERMDVDVDGEGSLASFA
ncbi:hypothetical protein JCM9279_000381 [Rhodotorula babjevae]